MTKERNVGIQLVKNTTISECLSFSDLPGLGTSQFEVARKFMEP
ncbi:hypothetical protein ACQVWA_28780 [Bacillus cereus]